ncbi:MAG: EAL domain-containing protein [Treponema sp.]|nr:EAL domain-containing protein [Candidatus Treponema equi]
MNKVSKSYHGTLCFVFAVYLFLVLANLKTGWIFRFDPVQGYVRGSLKYSTFIITGILVLVVELAVFHYRSALSTRMFSVFVIYPFVSAFVSTFQIVNENWLMSGCSGTVTMILMYIAIQSDRIEIDYKSGLKTETHLARTMRKKLKNCNLTMISVENLGVLQETYGATEVDLLIFNLVRSFHGCIHGTFFRNGSKFLIVSPVQNFEIIEKQIVEAFIKAKKSSSTKVMDNVFKYIAATVRIPDDVSTYDEAQELLKELLEHARKEKSCCIVHCNENFINDFKRKKTIIRILERELNTDSSQYQVYFQPIVSIAKNRFVYAEALSRLIGTEIGDISPGEFIPIAEDNGLIERLGKVNFEKVCEFISKNKDVVKAVSVNFSVYQMINPDTKDFVFSTIEKYGIKPENIIMEITESILIDDFELVRQRMEEFVKAGIVFYLDDFGTGFSNFVNVIRLPFYTIKIDRSFVLMMEKDEEMEKLVRNLVSTFKDSNLKILVEGVENSRQDQLVKKAGVDYIQGFLYSKPLPMDVYLKLLREQKKD